VELQQRRIFGLLGSPIDGAGESCLSGVDFSFRAASRQKIGCNFVATWLVHDFKVKAFKLERERLKFESMLSGNEIEQERET